MKSKKWFFEALETMLGFYDNYKVILGLSKEDAIKRTLETYNDFYEMLSSKEEFTSKVKKK